MIAPRGCGGLNCTSRGPRIGRSKWQDTEGNGNSSVRQICILTAPYIGKTLRMLVTFTAHRLHLIYFLLAAIAFDLSSRTFLTDARSETLSFHAQHVGYFSFHSLGKSAPMMCGGLSNSQCQGMKARSA